MEHTMDRPDFDRYAMNIALVVASRSTCSRRQIGAVITLNERIIATGFNGAVSKLPHCTDTYCIRDKQNIPSGHHPHICRAVHAEQNALLQCAQYGPPCFGATLYTTTSPCAICARMIANAGIARVVSLTEYSDLQALNIFRDKGVIHYKLNTEENQ